MGCQAFHHEVFTAVQSSWNYSTLINISFIKISDFLLETFKSAFYMRNLIYITTIGIFPQKLGHFFPNFENGQGRSFSLSPPTTPPLPRQLLVTHLGTPLKNTISLLFAKPPFKSTNYPSPLFRQSPLYIGFFMTPLLNSDFSVNPHNILSLIYIPYFKSNSVFR